MFLWVIQSTNQAAWAASLKFIFIVLVLFFWNAHELCKSSLILHCSASWRHFICDEFLRCPLGYAPLLSGLCFSCVPVLSICTLTEISCSPHPGPLSYQLLRCHGLRQTQIVESAEERAVVASALCLRRSIVLQHEEDHGEVSVNTGWQLSSQFKKQKLYYNLNHFLLECQPVLPEKFNQYSINTPYKVQHGGLPS